MVSRWSALWKIVEVGWKPEDGKSAEEDMAHSSVGNDEQAAGERPIVVEEEEVH